MAIKISYELSDNDYKSLKKQYEKNKSKLGNISFEEFITRSIDVAIKSHIQFTAMNEHMVDLFADFGLSSLKTGNQSTSAKDNMSKIDDLVHKIFQETVENNSSNKSQEKSNNKIKDNLDKNKKLN